MTVTAYDFDHFESSIQGHLLECNNNPSFDEFSVLAHRNKKCLLKLKESLLIKCDKPVSNKNISSAVLHLHLFVINNQKFKQLP